MNPDLDRKNLTLVWDLRLKYSFLVLLLQLLCICLECDLQSVICICNIKTPSAVILAYHSGTVPSQNLGKCWNTSYHTRHHGGSRTEVGPSSPYQRCSSNTPAMNSHQSGFTPSLILWISIGKNLFWRSWRR